MDSDSDGIDMTEDKKPQKNLDSVKNAVVLKLLLKKFLKKMAFWSVLLFFFNEKCLY